MSQNGKMVPQNMDQNSTRLLNPTGLQRIDHFIEEILITTAHVTFYEFNIEISQWSRKDVEGSCCQKVSTLGLQLCVMLTFIF
ncbi:hypothetical protein DY000_02010116 [Brassica cretica]|uniref:Uncharacterized protein n=1 Tax=Brassica cretica TaxID=69181 RepID=A0ABQ7CAP8_BRACR|nr:hypothetical protein DY000_02010116 [Brassica cretica]